MIPLAANQAIVRRYLLEREENTRMSTLGTYLSHIKSFGLFLQEREWSSATRDDVLFHIKQATNRNQGEVNHFQKGRPEGKRGPPAPPKKLGKYSKYQRMVMLREFYKWVLDDDDPVQFHKLPFKKPSLDEQMSGRFDVITPEEIRSMVDSAPNSQAACLLMLGYDTGYRAGELSLLNLEDIVTDRFGFTLQHHSPMEGLKTGPRRVPTRVTISRQFLESHLNENRVGASGPEPVFCSTSNRNGGVRLSPEAIWRIIHDLSKTAGLRLIHPHQLRHTAATRRAAAGWNEEMMRLQFGWSKGSAMPSYYSHLEDEFDEFSRKSHSYI